MKRTLVTLTVVALTTFGLASCSASEEKPAAEPTSQAPAESTPKAADTSSISACLEMAGPFYDASAAMNELAADNSDPQRVVDMYTELANAIGKIAESTTNPELKETATVAHADFTALRDALQKVYVDNDMGAMSDLLEATTAMQSSYSALLGNCHA